MRYFNLFAIALLLFSNCASAQLAQTGAGGIGTVTPPPSIALNFTTNTATGSCTTTNCLTVSRASAETCTDHLYNVTYAANNTPCITDLGWQSTWEARTNLMLNSGDLSNASWATFANGTGTISIVGNAAVAPDGTTTAAQITIQRSVATTSYAQVNQTFTGTAAGYSASIWLKASSATYANMQINIGLYNGTAFTPLPMASAKLTTNWVRYTLPSATLAASAGCQFVIGFVPSVSGGNSQIGTVVFDAAFAQAELGPTVSPYIPNTSSATTRPADVVTATGALATLLGGSTGTIEAWSNKSGASATSATLFDASGTVLLGFNSSNNATTSVGATLASSNIGAWGSVNNVGLSWSSAGGILDLYGTTVTDATARTPSGTFHLGSTGGTSNFWNGNIAGLQFYTTKQSLPQYPLPTGVMSGFLNVYSNSPLVGTGIQFRDFSGVVKSNGGSPIFLGNQGSYDTYGTNTPYLAASNKIGSTYYALSFTAIDTSNAQNWINAALYTTSSAPSTANWTASASNPVFTHTAGTTTDDHYLLHAATTNSCTLASWATFYSAMGSDNNWRIFLATAPDGVTYTKLGAVLQPDSAHGVPNPGLPSVIAVGSTLYMFVVNNGNASQSIAYYTSPLTDCQNWTYGGTALAAPIASDWDAGLTAYLDPWVILNKHGWFEMTYTAYFTGVQYIGYAVSPTIPATFTKYSLGNIPITQPLTYTGDNVPLELSSSFTLLYDGDNGTNTSNPYAATLPPY